LTYNVEADPGGMRVVFLIIRGAWPPVQLTKRLDRGKMSVNTETVRYPTLDTVEFGHAVLASPRGVSSRRRARGEAASWGR